MPCAQALPDLPLRQEEALGAFQRWGIGDLPLRLEAVSPAAKSGWYLFARDINGYRAACLTAENWLDEHDLNGKVFRTRHEAVRLVQALLLDDPLPYKTTLPLAALCKVAEDEWVSLDQQWGVHRVARQRYEVTHRPDSDKQLKWHFCTLRSVRLFLTTDSATETK